MGKVKQVGHDFLKKHDTQRRQWLESIKQLVQPTDYSNALYTGLPKAAVTTLQTIQSAVAKV